MKNAHQVVNNIFYLLGGFPGGSDGKALPAMRETGVRFPGREDSLEKEMEIHSSTLAWKIPWTEEPDMLQSMGSQRVGHDRVTSLSLSSDVHNIISELFCRIKSPANGRLGEVLCILRVTVCRSSSDSRWSLGWRISGPAHTLILISSPDLELLL